jgi:uncharacterized protein with HEPN domain
VVRELAIVCEAARRIDESIQKIYSDIPWSDIIGMRHKLIHDYFEIDIDEVWRTAQDDLPVLREQVQAMIQDLDK